MTSSVTFGECMMSGEVTLSEYQREANHHSMYPHIEAARFAYPLLGLAGEVGELCNDYKKILRERRWINESDKEAMVLELGDVLWYVAAVATELGVDLGTVALKNLSKLEQRKQKKAA